MQTQSKVTLSNVDIMRGADVFDYDCDFNQMMNLPAKSRNSETLTVSKLLEAGSLDLISEIQTAAYCYGCTAGCGSSCGGALL